MLLTHFTSKCTPKLTLTGRHLHWNIDTSVDIPFGGDCLQTALIMRCLYVKMLPVSPISSLPLAYTNQHSAWLIQRSLWSHFVPTLLNYTLFLLTPNELHEIIGKPLRYLSGSQAQLYLSLTISLLPPKTLYGSKGEYCMQCQSFFCVSTCQNDSPWQSHVLFHVTYVCEK